MYQPRLSPSLFQSVIHEAREFIAELEDERDLAITQGDRAHAAFLERAIALLRNGLAEAINDYTPDLNLN